MVCPMEIFSTMYGSLYVAVCGEFSPVESRAAACCGRCRPNCGAWLPLLCVPLAAAIGGLQLLQWCAVMLLELMVPFLGV